MWADEKVRELKDAWVDGLSPGEISRKIGMSKRAVACKASRLKLKPRSARSRLKARGRRINRAFTGSHRQPDQVAKPTPIVEDPSDIAGVSLLDKEHGECSWPVGDPRSPDFGFCGSETKPGSSYCEKHHARAYQPATEFVMAPEDRDALITLRIQAKGRDSTPDVCEAIELTLGSTAR